MAGTTMPSASGHEDEASANDQGEWPDWQIDPAAAAWLARYVSALHTASWVPTDLLYPLRGGTEAGHRQDRAARLYRALAARRIPYASAPWNPAAYDPQGQPVYQRIRTPAETIQGPATCLDLVLTFAGMAAEADLRPLIAIRFHPAPHALVVLELSGGMSEPTDYHRWPAPPGFTERPEQPGVWDQTRPLDQPLVQLAQTRDWLSIDVEGATRDYNWEYARAAGWTEVAKMAKEEEKSGSHWVLVDVRRVLADLNANRVEPYKPPRGRSVPAIHSYLPAFPDFLEFPTRSGVADELQGLIDAGEPATLVIQAPSGYGKSMLAHRLAAGADYGCGWFLNATDARELTRSLAAAERGEHELGGEPPRPGGEKADAADDPAFAAAALDRLRTAERPWVVVVDNCDSPPDSPGLRDLLPKPHAAGQVVIITTTHPGWLEFPADSRHRVELAGLADSDLRELKLATGLAASVAGRPLIALALVALRDRAGAILPASTGQDGPALVWDLLRGSARADHDTAELARFLAWLPPEPMPEQALGKIAALDASPGDTLAELRCVTRSASAVPSVSADSTDAGSPGLVMHRLFSAAVREQTWRDAPEAAADVIARLLTTEGGRWLFITAADATALARLERGGHPDKPEPGDVELAVRRIIDRLKRSGLAPGLLWHGLGHIRERRGPVIASREPFAKAVEALDPASWPYQVAESRIGLARVVFQDNRSTMPDLEKAQGWTREAEGLLAPLVGQEARQLSEQGNALDWLIAQKLAGREPDLEVREARFSEVQENLWSSFAQRLRIARDLGDGEPVSDDAVPGLDDGLGPERAFYNLAGVTIQLAKTRHELAVRAAETGRELEIGDDRLRSAEQSLREAERVYDVVRELREKRYGGRPHPHLAACLNGLAITAYYRAALLGQTGELAGAGANAAAALDQRARVAGSLVGPGTAAVLQDPDVRKSVDLQLKIMAASVLARFGDPVSGSNAVTAVLREAIGEWMDGPGRTPAEGTGDTDRPPTVLGYEHEVHVELPPDVLARFTGTTAAAEAIQGALAQIGPLARAAADIEVLGVTPSEPEEVRAAGSLRVGLALPVPVGKQMDAALRWTIANAIRTPDPSWLPESGSPREAASSVPGEAYQVVTRDRPDPPRPQGFVEAPRRKSRPRYLSASYPDLVQPGQRFSVEAAVVLSRGAGRTEQRMRDFEVGPLGKQLRLTIYAPKLTVHGDYEQLVFVPPDTDSDPVRFDLEGAVTGVQRIRLRAWEDGTCVGELVAEVTVSDRVSGGSSRMSTSEMESEAAPGEITLEVSSEMINGQNRYWFQLQDPVTAPARVFLPLREDPAADLEGLILRLDALAEGPGGYTSSQRYRALVKEGKQLWEGLVPPAVQEQFWACQHRIGQLTIIADNDAMPWELLYPWDNANDAGFLVEQGFPVTRRVHGYPRRRLLRRLPARFVLPHAGLPGAENEINVLKQLFRAPEPTISTLQELQELIDDGAFGVLHFACHASFSTSDRGQQIDLDLPFMPRELVDAGGTWQAPLVFLNACRSAGPRQRCMGLDSFAERFIRAKAGAFIGSLWEVRDRTASEFAQELYLSLLADQTLGQAVTDLRSRAKDGDPTWLAYAVYGDPRAKLV